MHELLQKVVEAAPVSAMWLSLYAVGVVVTGWLTGRRRGATKR